MNLWKASYVAMRGAARTGQRISDDAGSSFRGRQAQRLPRRVAQRGYLIPGDQAPPPGYDLPDFRGLADSSRVRSSDGSAAVSLGRAIDLDSGIAGAPVWAGMRQFFQHAAVVAPPGSGKTYGVIAPWTVRLLRAGATVVVLDVTGALRDQLRDFASSTAGPASATVRTIEWTLHPRRSSKSWNPLAGVRPDDLVAIEGLKSAIAGDEPPDPRHRDFHDRDLRTLGTILRAALASGSPTLADIAEAMSDQAAFDRVMQSSGRASLDWDELRESWTLRNKLEVFAEPTARARTGSSDFTIDNITDHHTLAIIGAELELKASSQAASALFINRLIGHLQSRYTSASPRPVILMIDEAPVVAKRIDLPAILATARATSTGVVLACQNVTQFGGEAEQSTVFDACDMMVLLPGASEPSIRLFQGRLGQRDVDRVSLGSDLGRSNRVARVDHSSERVAMVGDRELLQPPFGRHPAIIHARSMHAQPFAVELDRSPQAG